MRQDPKTEKAAIDFARLAYFEDWEPTVTDCRNELSKLVECEPFAISSAAVVNFSRAVNAELARLAREGEPKASDVDKAADGEGFGK